MFRWLKVSGDSLAPSYQDGDFVLVAKIPFPIHNLKHGDIIVFRHPYYGMMIKCVDHVLSEGDIYVMGSQSDSVDSRQLGPIPKRDLLGKVIWHLRKPRR